MNPIVRRLLPVGVVPGLHLESGHHKAEPRDLGCNMRRRLNLYRPERVRLVLARRVPVAEWEASR